MVVAIVTKLYMGNSQLALYICLEPRPAIPETSARSSSWYSLKSNLLIGSEFANIFTYPSLVHTKISSANPSFKKS